MKNNPVLNENKQLITTYNLRKELVKSSTAGPTIFTTANYLFAPTFNDYGYDSAVTNGGLYSAMLNLDYPIFKGPSLNVKLKNAELEQSTYTNTIALTEHDIRKNVTDQYVKTYIDLKQITYLDETLNILESQKMILDSLAAYGLSKMSDIKLLDIEYQSQLIIRKKQENLYKGDLLDLNLLAGINDTSTFNIPEPGLRFEKNEITNSVFLNQFKTDSVKLDVEQRISELNYEPQLDFFINGGLNAVSYNNIYKKIGFSTGLNFTFTLYDGNQRDLSRQLTAVKQNILSFNKRNFIKQKSIRKINIAKELYNLDSIYILQQNQIDNYLTLLDMYRSQTLTGQLSIIDYINTLKNFSSAKSDLLSTESERLNLINEYNYWNW